MKSRKAICCLAVITLSLSLLLVGMFPTAAEVGGYEEYDYTSNFFYDFSTSESFTALREDNHTRYQTQPTLVKMGGTQNGNFKYHASKAATLTIASGNTPYETAENFDKVCGFKIGCSVDGYMADVATHTVLAMKVQLFTGTETLGAIEVAMRGGAADGVYGEREGATLTAVPTYEAHKDWQLVVADLSKANLSADMQRIIEENVANGTTSNWYQVNIETAASGTGTYGVYVAWIGIFKNEEAAYAHYKKTTPTPATGAPTFLFDFSTQEKYEDMMNFNTGSTTARTVVNNNSNTAGTGYTAKYGTLSYDAANEAMKLVSTDQFYPMLQVQCLDWRSTVRMRENTVCALKVKVPAGATVDSANVFANDGAAAATAGAQQKLLKKPVYESDTTGWQLLLIDVSSDNWGTSLTTIDETNTSSSTVSNWWGFNVALDNELVANKEYYIQWAGIFADAAAARAYYVGDVYGQAAMTAELQDYFTRLGLDSATVSGVTMPDGEYVDAAAVQAALEAQKEQVSNANFAKLTNGAGKQARPFDCTVRFVLELNKSLLVELYGTYGADKVEYGTLLARGDLYTGDMTYNTDKVGKFYTTAATVVPNTSKFTIEYDKVMPGDVWSYTCVVRNIPESYKTTTLRARSYIKYVDKAGVSHIIYGAETSTNYEEMITAAEAQRPEIKNADNPTYDTLQESANAITNLSATDLGKITSALFTVSEYDAENTYKHHPCMTVYKGKVYVAYSQGASYEDAPGQQAVVTSASLTDLTTWATPKVIVPSRCSDETNGHDTFVIPGFFHVDNGILMLYSTEKAYTDACFDGEGNFKNTKADYLVSNRIAAMWRRVSYTVDGVNWVDAQVNFAANESPELTLSGTWLAGAGNQAIVNDNFLDNPLSFKKVGTGSDTTLIDQNGAPLTEASWYQTDDYVIHLMLRSSDGRLYVRESYDNGETWTEACRTNFESQTSMSTFGRLPDGRFYCVGNPTYSTTGERTPLSLYVSDDGYNFNKAYALRDETVTLQDENWTKVVGYQYPEAMVYGDYLYVLHSAGKETISLTRVALTDIQ